MHRTFSRVVTVIVALCSTHTLLLAQEHTHSDPSVLARQLIPHCGMKLPRGYDPYARATINGTSCCNGGDCCPVDVTIEGGQVQFLVDGRLYTVPITDPRILEAEYPLSDDEERLKRKIPEHEAIRRHLGNRWSRCAQYDEHGELNIRCLLRPRLGS